MLRWYGFGGRLRKTNFPAMSVVVVRLNPETGLLIVTVTACMTPPVGSLTVPWTVPAPAELLGREATGIDTGKHDSEQDKKDTNT